MKTTLNKIRAHSPCADGWKKLLAHLGKTQADDEPLGIVAVLDSNGMHDAIWCLRAVEGHDREIRLYAVWCARQVQHLMADQRSVAALDVAERHANGMATDTELDAAVDAAGAAAGAAAWSAAWSAAGAAAVDAAGAAAGAAAWSDAGAAAWSAAWSAAGAAAWSAAGAAAWSAAGDVAWAAARASQEKELRRICAATLAAQPGAVGEWKRVPVEPTQEMIDATYVGQHCSDIWRDMLAAAPTEAKPAQPTALTQAERRELIDRAGDITDGLNQDDFADEIINQVLAVISVKKGG